MKTPILFLLTACLSIGLLQACGDSGPSQEEIQQRLQAERDSLEQVYAQQLEQARLDSIAQAQADSIAAEEERRRVQYSETGPYLVQVAAWRSPAKAQQQADAWMERGYERAFVVEYGTPETGDVWYRVRIGRFETRDMAERVQDNLRQDHDAQSWISRVGQPMRSEERGE
ncbi:MAG: SPOR domain-containing protein [Balneolaceae bacterium]